MRNVLRKSIALFSMGVFFTGIGVPVKASETEWVQEYGVDEEKYNVNWNETQKVWVKQDCKSTDSDFNEGTSLGYVRVQTGIATSKENDGDKYSQKILIKGEMIPQVVRGDKRGMSRYLTLQVANNFFTGYMDNKIIEPMSGILTDSGNTLSVITNIDDNGYAKWEYDYTAYVNSDSEINYLYNPSIQYGVLSWDVKESKSPIYPDLKLKISATYGGGSISGNTIINRFGTKNYDIGTVDAEIIIPYRLRGMDL